MVKYLVRVLNINTKDKHGIASLHYADKKGNLCIVKDLAKQEINVTNILVNDSKMVFHIAVISLILDLVKYFFDHMEVAFNNKDENSLTSLHCPCNKGN